LNRIALEVYTAIRERFVVMKKPVLSTRAQTPGMYKDGRYVDILLMSVLREEWLPGKDARITGS